MGSRNVAGLPLKEEGLPTKLSFRGFYGTYDLAVSGRTYRIVWSPDRKAAEARPLTGAADDTASSDPAPAAGSGS